MYLISACDIFMFQYDCFSFIHIRLTHHSDSLMKIFGAERYLIVNK